MTVKCLRFIQIVLFKYLKICISKVDPLFHKTSAAFDEGGTGGLLLNHLFVRDDSCELLLDSSTVTMTARDALSQGQTTQDSNMIDLSELRGASDCCKLMEYVHFSCTFPRLQPCTQD